VGGGGWIVACLDVAVKGGDVYVRIKFESSLACDLHEWVVSW